MIGVTALQVMLDKWYSIEPISQKLQRFFRRAPRWPTYWVSVTCVKSAGQKCFAIRPARAHWNAAKEI
jgi:hypothetical protein